MPLLVGKAWQYSTTLKILYAEDLPAQVSALGASVPSVLIYKKGAQKYHLTGAELTEFVDSFDITKAWGVTTSPTTIATTAETVASESPPSTDR